MRPKCFWPFILATTVPLNIICGGFGLDFLHENKTAVACFLGQDEILISIDAPTDQ